MTRKKAIEAAMKRLRAISEAATVRDDHGGVRYEGKPTPGDVQEEMAYIWNEARIAGLREAARMAADYKNRRAMQPDQFSTAAVIEFMVSDLARALANPKKAKKARGR